MYNSKKKRYKNFELLVRPANMPLYYKYFLYRSIIVKHFRFLIWKVKEIIIENQSINDITLYIGAPYEN